jgi:hypothetical protein
MKVQFLGRIVIGCSMAAAMAPPSRADIVLAEWTFETSGSSLTLSNSPTSPDADAEGGFFAGATSVANGVHASAGTDWSSPAGNGSAESFSANDWSVGDYWQFTTSTTGFLGISISWHQTRSGTGPATFDLQWSTDGTTWTNLLDDYTVLENSAANGGTWNATTLIPNYIFAPVAGPAALDNQAAIFFRLACDAAPGGAAGTNRVDNVIIAAAIPAPGALALLGVAGLVSGRRRRR